MTKREENQLVTLLKKLYGQDWQLNWQGEDDGFSLTIEVQKQPKESVR